MALRLNAEQKYIRDIFSGKIEYIIPPYQRAYSWNKEHCEVLFEDLKSAFLTNDEQAWNESDPADSWEEKKVKFVGKMQDKR